MQGRTKLPRAVIKQTAARQLLMHSRCMTPSSRVDVVASSRQIAVNNKTRGTTNGSSNRLSDLGGVDYVARHVLAQLSS
jgi:hypothetical protein